MLRVFSPWRSEILAYLVIAFPPGIGVHKAHVPQRNRRELNRQHFQIELDVARQNAYNVNNELRNARPSLTIKLVAKELRHARKNANTIEWRVTAAQDD